MPFDGVLAIPLDRPGQRPDPSGPLQSAATDAAVRVVVLRIGPGAAVDAALVRQLPQPVLASVQGACDAAGLAILEACDIVFAADDARFAVDGALVDGREAERSGLVTLAFPAAQLEAQVQALARDLAAKDPLALRLTKETLRDVGAVAWDAVLDYNAAKVAQLRSLQEGQPSSRAAGVASFLAGKSKPGLGG